MKNPMTKKLVTAGIAAVIAWLLSQLTGIILNVMIRNLGLGLIPTLLLGIPFDAVENIGGFLLAYLITVALICKEKTVMKKAFVGALCFFGFDIVADFIAGFLVGLICPLLGLDFTVQSTIQSVLTLIASFLAAFLASSICFREPKAVPEFAPYGQAPYGAPQAPYGQAPYGIPQAPYGQAPYGAPQQAPYGQAPYGAPQQAPYGQAPYGQVPYGAPQQAPYGQAPYGAPQVPYGQAPYGVPQPYNYAVPQEPQNNSQPPVNDSMQNI